MISRRLLLGAAGASLAPAVWTRAAAQGRAGEFPFKLGVASGEPLPDGVVLWTRLSTDPTALTGFGPGAVDVAWEIAEDEGFRRVVGHGEAKARADEGHSVHVEAAGLKPGREYWYR